MKTFMEEYGLIVVAILVVAALIGLAVSFNKKASTNSNDSIDKFTNKANNYIEEGLKGDNNTTNQGGTNQGGTKQPE